MPEHKLFGRFGQIVVVAKKNVICFFELRGSSEVEKSLATESSKGDSMVEYHVRKIVVTIKREG